MVSNRTDRNAFHDGQVHAMTWRAESSSYTFDVALGLEYSMVCLATCRSQALHCWGMAKVRKITEIRVSIRKQST